MRKRLILILMCAALALTLLASCREDTEQPETPLTAAQLLNLGDKFLRDLDYEQAIVYFTRLLEIEPMNPRGYTGLAEAYIGLGDVDSAAAILEQGLEALPDDADIAEMLETVAAAPEVTPTPTPEPIAEPLTEPIPDYITIRGVEYSTSLTELLLSNSNNTDLTNEDIVPLRYMTNLTWLELSDTQISDLSPLSGLTNLTILNLYFNQISDLSPLRGLTNLTWLGLDNNQISDLTPLAGLTNLTGLSLGDNQISDISPLRGLTNLTWLILWDNPITDWSPVSHMLTVYGRP